MPNPHPLFYRRVDALIFFVYFVQDCACVVVNPCVSRKFINQPSAKSSLILFKLHTIEWEHTHRTGYFIIKVVQQGL